MGRYGVPCWDDGARDGDDWAPGPARPIGGAGMYGLGWADDPPVTRESLREPGDDWAAGRACVGGA